MSSSVLIPSLFLAVTAALPDCAFARDRSPDSTLSVFLGAVETANARMAIGMLSDDSRREAMAAADSLRAVLLSMETQDAGEFLSGFGMVAAPDEIPYWEPADFLELLLLSADIDSSGVRPERSGGRWLIDCREGFFTGMLMELDLPPD